MSLRTTENPMKHSKDRLAGKGKMGDPDQGAAALSSAKGKILSNLKKGGLA